MANYGWPDCKPLFVDEYDFVGDGLTTMDLGIPGAQRVTEDATGAGGTGWLQHLLTGERQATGPVTMMAFYDGAAAPSTDAALQDSAAVRVLVAGYEGGTVGTRFAGGTGFQTQYERTVGKGALHKAKGTFLVTSHYDDAAKILTPLSAKAIDGNSQATSVDNAAASSNGGGAYFVVKSITLGTATSLTLKVMHSTDNVTFVALATSAAFTVAGAEQVVVAAATTVNRYLAGLWDYAGTPDGTTTASIFIGFGRR